MMIRKMMVVMVLARDGVVLGFKMRAALQVMLRIGGWEVGAGFIDVSVAGVCGDV